MAICGCSRTNTMLPSVLIERKILVMNFRTLYFFFLLEYLLSLHEMNPRPEAFVSWLSFMIYKVI